MKKILMLLTSACFSLIFAFLLSATALSAAEGAPRIYAGEGRAQQGGIAYININAENFEKVGSMEVTVFYEPSAFSVRAVSEMGLNADNLCEKNNDAGNGALRLTALSLGGISGSGTLWRIEFDVSVNAEPGSYRIVVAAGEVSAVDLTSVSVAVGNGTIEVTERTEYIQTMYVYSFVGAAAYEGEETSVSFYTYTACGLAAAEFEIGYDSNRLLLEEVSLGKTLTGANGAIQSVNDKIDGYIKISYACLTGIGGSANPLVTCRFTVLGNEEGSVPVSFSSGGLYDSAGNAIKSDVVTAQIETLYRVPPVELPEISVESRENVCGEFTVNVVAEGKSGLAAADIIVTYDPEKLECLSVTKIADNAMVVGKPDYDAGKAKFSFLCEDGITEDTALAALTFRPLVSAGTDLLIVSGVKLVDAAFRNVEAEYIAGSVSFAAHDWSEWALSGDRIIGRACANCGEAQEVEVAGGATLTLEDEIKVNYKAWLRDPDTREVLLAEEFGWNVSASVALYASADEETAESVLIMDFDGGYYVAQNARTYAAKEIADSHWLEIEVTLNGISVRFARREYSPAIYAMNQLSAAGEFGEMKNLALSLLDYGAAAQLYFGYKTESLANAEVTAEMRATAEAYRETVYTQNKPFIPQELPAFEYPVGMSLNLDGKVTINGYLTAEDGADVRMAVFDSEDSAADISRAKEVVRMSLQDGRYRGTTSTTQFAAKQFGDDVYVVFYVNGEAATPAIRYGVKNYAYRMLGKQNTTESMRALCETILGYASAAQLYFDYHADDLANAGLTQCQ